MMFFALWSLDSSGVLCLFYVLCWSVIVWWVLCSLVCARYRYSLHVLPVLCPPHSFFFSLNALSEQSSSIRRALHRHRRSREFEQWCFSSLNFIFSSCFYSQLLSCVDNCGYQSCLTIFLRTSNLRSFRCSLGKERNVRWACAVSCFVLKPTSTNSLCAVLCSVGLLNINLPFWTP